MRSPARKRRIPRIRQTSRGNSFGMGVVVNDQVSGLPVPRQLTVKQRGGRVDARYSENTRDKPESY